jgi:type I restriction enzyme S subunit
VVPRAAQLGLFHTAKQPSEKVLRSGRMFYDLKPYPATKDSGVPWLQEIPAHWEVKPGFAAYREKQRKNTGLPEKRVLSLSYGRIVVKPEDKLHGLVPESFETYQIIRPGDIIIRSTDLQNDWNSLRVGLARDPGIITSAYICLNTVGPLTPEYGYQQLNAYDLMKVFYGMGSGLRQNLDFSDFKRMPILFPPLEEQSAIVQFLDHADRLIRRYIRAKRRLIELLNEQKQAIIQKGVTRGLDPSVRLKPSGIDCLGDVPAHWHVRRVRSLVSSIDQGVSPQAEAILADDMSWGVLKAGCVNHGVFREKEHKRLPDGFAFDRSLAVRVGDVLVSRACGSPKLVGSVGRVRSLWYRLVLSDKTFRLNFREPLLAEFLVAAMNTRYFRVQVEQAISGAEGLANNIPLSALKDFRLAVPPATEGVAIAQRLSNEAAEIDTLMETAAREADLISEYRTRLIADVVTGKLDVRGVELAALEETEELSPAADEAFSEATEEETELEQVEEGADAIG